MLKQLVEDVVEYTRTYSINEEEWYWNINSSRKGSKDIDRETFEKAIREEVLYDLVYNINSFKSQLETDYEYNEGEIFDKANKKIEKEIQNFDKNFKINRY